MWCGIAQQNVPLSISIYTDKLIFDKNYKSLSDIHVGEQSCKGSSRFQRGFCSFLKNNSYPHVPAKILKQPLEKEQ